MINNENNNNQWLTNIIACNTLCSPEEQESKQARTAREDVKYNSLPEMVQIKIADGYFTFSRNSCTLDHKFHTTFAITTTLMPDLPLPPKAWGL
jgi:hypothetical protein